jgi:cytochrome c oxidase assembly protein subunit 15
VLVVWKCDRRRWLQWLTIAALALVIVQGVLGGMRVHLDRVQLAKLHGCIGPIFLALTVAIMFATSTRWRTSLRFSTSPSLVRFQLQAILIAVLAYSQLLVGAQVRHLPAGASTGWFRLAVIFHVVLAVFLAGAAAVIVAAVLRNRKEFSVFTRSAFVLLALIVFQLGLGLATWAVKYSMPFEVSHFFGGWTNVAGSAGQSITITAHVVTGSLILSVAVYTSLYALRLAKNPVEGIAPCNTVLEAAR